MKNKYEIRGDVTAIFLKGKNGLDYETIIDTEDLEKIQSIDVNWYDHANRGNEKGYAKAVQISNGTRINLALHRVIMSAPTGLFVDHINRNTLDNRKSNLRIVTPAQNAQNYGIRKDSSSKVRGVNWSSLHNGWLARIQVSGKRIYVGLFFDLEEARIAVEQARAKHMAFSEEAITLDVQDDVIPKIKEAHGKRPQRNTLSKAKGVYWNERINRWNATVYDKSLKRNKSIGHFRTIAEAEGAIVQYKNRGET